MNQARNKILYVASTASHLCRFHQPYLDRLRETGDVFTMADGEGVDFPVRMQKKMFSSANLRTVRQIRAILKKESFDRIIVNTTLAAFLVRLALRGVKERPFVLNIVHGYLFSRPAKGIRDRLMLSVEKWLYRQTDAIAVMNGEDWETVQKYRLCRGKTFLIPGMGLPASLLPPPDPDLRARFAPSAGDLLCVYVGELSRRKNQIFLIRAVAALRASGAPIRLLLLGEGTERDTLTGEILRLGLEDSVFLEGNREPVTPYLAIADVYVSASRSEGLPFNILEAMAAGLPICASNTKGQSDLLYGEKDCLYPAGDEDAFCALLKKRMADGHLGAGSCRYPILEAYRLENVLEENLKLMNLEK